MISPNTQETFISEKTKSASSPKVICPQACQRMLEDDVNIQSYIILTVFLTTIDHHHGEKDQHLGELFTDSVTKLRNLKEEFL